MAAQDRFFLSSSSTLVVASFSRFVVVHGVLRLKREDVQSAFSAARTMNIRRVLQEGHRHTQQGAHFSPPMAIGRD